MKDVLNFLHVFMPTDSSKCAGCMYNTFLGCNAPEEFRETCPNSPTVKGDDA